MGKGNAILGYARGAVGSIVFARVKGQQIIRARNSKPHNRNSRAQILHRSRLSTLYKFTKQLPPGLLEGAFEDQRPRENWQSCFVRHNTERAIMQPKTWVEDESKPALGRWLMSCGSIKADLVEFSTLEAGTYLGCIGIKYPLQGFTNTVGALSAYLMDTYGVKRGDILLFIAYAMGPLYIPRDPRYLAAEKTNKLYVDKFVVDPDDDRVVDEVMLHVGQFAYPDEQGQPWGWVGFRDTIEHTHQVAIIVARNEEGKTLTNTAVMNTVGNASAFWQKYEDDEWVFNVLRSWGVSKTALLKGLE